MERNEVDAEMENWQVDVFDPAVQSYISGSGVISPPREIGWTGREGLFAMPGLVRDIPFADFYRFYEARQSDIGGLLRCMPLHRMTIGDNHQKR